ncbi:MAG: RNA chaperone Hfq [bacterium]|nr:RNA chaperone Hfq [bacterium]MDY2830029.1 RNA chaperone Hfq [Alphaproteobacteria bacterium]
MSTNRDIETNFLDKLKKDEASVTVFLVNGVKLQGIITWFDEATLLLRRDGHTQLIYKHAVSTIMPGEAIEL